VENASKVLREGTPELVKAVEQGQVAVSTAALIAEVPAAEQKEIVAKGEKEILKAAKEIRAQKEEIRREERINKIANISKNNLPLENGIGLFPVIYCDPPWQYSAHSDPADDIENHYPTMSLQEICKLPLDKITTPDAILFLWTTSPLLYEAMRVLDTWGFTYKTSAVWDKEHIGMGYYFRIRHELLLVATKGQMPSPPPSARVDSVIQEKKTTHSTKPICFYEIIEIMYPQLPKLEMFARNARQGWQAWGNQSVGGKNGKN
ncbi:MAG: MT-A70 family protein, partial [bacterium]